MVRSPIRPKRPKRPDRPTRHRRLRIDYPAGGNVRGVAGCLRGGRC